MGAYARVWVLGGAGSGKSTFAREYASLSGAHYIELDRVYWLKNWTPKESSRFRAEIRELLQEPSRWVVDGQYPEVVEEFISLAECVVWLDTPLYVSWPRLFFRTISRWLGRKRLWAGNRENFISIIGPRSILWYALKERARQREDNQRLFCQLEGGDTALVRSRTHDVGSLARQISCGVDD